MARANLTIGSEINEAFFAAQEGRSIRCLRIKIEGEAMKLDGQINSVGTPKEDFDALRDTLLENEASFLIFSLADASTAAQTWMLFCWVPDGCKVRDKMLYSSSREDLKRTLGLGYFSSEYSANLLSDVTWELYEKSQNREFGHDILTETERLVLEEKSLTITESNKSKASAMGVINFEMTSEVVEKLNEFKAGSVNWVAMTVSNETVTLVSHKTVANSDKFQPLVSEEVASFIAIRLPKQSGELISIFIFSCPENIPVRSKMTMSSSKASVLSSAQSLGITFDRALEIRGSDEIDGMLHVELGDATTDANAVSSSAASIAHSKPTRPGKGRAKVGKFQADEN